MIKDNLKERHKGDLKTLYKIYTSDKPFYDNFYFQIAIGLSLAYTFLIIITGSDVHNLIIYLSQIALNALPTLLGFNLGAYILLVGFASSDILKTITKPLTGQKHYSFYQKLNGVLGMSVLIQISTLFISFNITMWDEIQDKTSISFIPYWLSTSFNIFVLLIFLILVIYSLLLLINVVKHVFMFAQTIHFCIYNKVVRAEGKSKDDEGKTQAILDLNKVMADLAKEIKDLKEGK